LGEGDWDDYLFYDRPERETEEVPSTSSQLWEVVAPDRKNQVDGGAELHGLKVEQDGGCEKDVKVQFGEIWNFVATQISWRARNAEKIVVRRPHITSPPTYLALKPSFDHPSLHHERIVKFRMTFPAGPSSATPELPE
jgi:hypothetical protein